MADGLVTSYVTSATAMLGKANEAGFNSVVSGINATALAVATLAFLLAIFNQFLQISYMSPSKMLGLMIKNILIAYFAMNWEHFSAVSNAIEKGMDSISVTLLETVTSGANGSASLTGSIDAILSSMATASNSALKHTGWVAGAFLTILVVACLALLGAVSALLIIYSKIMISVFIMLAPAFICCLIFERTADYFYRWLQGAITYALYPVITAAIMSLIAGVTNSYIESIASSKLNSITEFIPFITVIVIAIIVIICIPTIVSGLSGMIQHASPLHIANPMLAVLSKMKQKKQDDKDNENSGVGGQSSNLKLSSRNQGLDPSHKGPAEMLARDKRITGKD